MASKLILSAFVIIGAVLITYAGVALMASVSEALTHIPVGR